MFDPTITSQCSHLGGRTIDAQLQEQMQAVSDAALIARMAAGDQRSLAELYDRHGPAMYGLALAITGQPADADEVVAEAFNQAWRQADRFDSTRGSSLPWLVTLTRSRALDFVRAGRRRARALDRASAAAPGGFALPVSPLMDPPDRYAEKQDLRERVQQAVAELPDAQRRVVELAYFGGLSQSEIAAQLQAPLGTVKTRMRAAMEKLRGALATYISQE